MARGIEVVVVIDRLPIAQSRLRPIVAREVRAQGFQTETDMKGNIAAAGRVDSGLMLNTTRFRPTGELSGEVGPSAESAGGFPYPIVQEFGSVRGVTPALFATQAGEKAAREFPERFRGLEGRLL